MAKVEVDLQQVENLCKEIRAATVVSLGRLGDRGYQLLRKEVPKDTRNLMQGVAPPALDESSLTVTLTVSATSGRTGSSGTLHLPSGKTKSISLKPQIAFNYAEVVAKGRPAIRPKAGRALIIGVEGTPKGAYISAGGKNYIVRTSVKAQKPNPYDERAKNQLKAEAPKIVSTVFGELFN